MAGKISVDDLSHIKTILLSQSTRDVIETESLEIKLLHIKPNAPKTSNFIPVLISILRTRGLLRFIGFNYLSKSNLFFKQSYQISRIRLGLKMFSERRLVKNFLKTHLRFEIIRNYEQREFQHLHLWNYVNPDYNMELDANTPTIFWREYAVGQPVTLRYGSKNSQTLISQLLIWNLKFTINLIHELEITSELLPQVNELSPVLGQILTSRQALKINCLSNSEKTYDYYLTTEGKLDIPFSMQNVQLWHQRFVVKDNTLVFYDIATSLDLPFVAGHWQYLEQRHRQSNVAILQSPSEIIQRIDKGALLSGRADENWFHFIYDTLPKLCFLEDLPLDIPLIIRSDIPPTSIAFLKSITDRRLIQVSPNETLMIETLYFLPSRSTVLDSSSRKLQLPRVAFSPVTLARLRDNIAERRSGIAVSQTITNLIFSRQTKYRRLLNLQSILKLSFRFQFEEIELNESFYSIQDEVFRNAETVISPGGALFANILFMRKGSSLICLHSWRGKDLALWRKLCEAMGVNYFEVNGIPTYFGPSKLQREHSNFYIPRRKLSKILEVLKA